jgi:glycosyltransferase involved in cell wall biosynthesis
MLDADEFRRGVVLTGPVADEELPGFYRAAAVVAFPSLHEGFGIPPIEAMACGTPSVVSPGGALREVVGDAAWLLDDPRDDVELANALEQVLVDGACRRDLIEKGFRRAPVFSAERAAEQTLALYKEVVAGATKRSR